MAVPGQTVPFPKEHGWIRRGTEIEVASEVGYNIKLVLLELRQSCTTMAMPLDVPVSQDFTGR